MLNAMIKKYLKKLMSNMWPQIEGIVSRISKTNALYPLLVTLLFMSFLALSVFGLTESLLLRFCVLLIVGLVVVEIIRSFDFFMHNKPDMLRSEKMVIQQQVLTLLGDDRNLSASAKDIIAVINPSNPILESDRIENKLTQEVTYKQIDISKDE